MYFVYSLLLTLGLIALLPRFLFDAIKHGKYIAGLRERLGKIPTVATEGPLVWLHCVSVGETEAARPLVQALIARFPTFSFVVSTTTLTGQTFARRVFAGQAAAVFYFPFDWGWTVRRALRGLDPAAVLIMETELWPRMLHECRRRDIPVALVNGRISERSFRGYRRLGGFISRVVKDLNIALMQSESDADRLRQLGLPPDRILISGNLKFDGAEAANASDATRELANRFNLNRQVPLIIAASTHHPEELVALEAFKPLAGQARLMIVPRHPERFDETASLLQQSNLKWARRSAFADESDKTSDVILLDSIGELRAAFPLADLVFVGGSIATHGGHNMLEPAAAGACVVTGPHTQNFTAIMKALLDKKAIIQLSGRTTDECGSELASVFKRLLEDDKQRQELAARAKSVCEQNRGATDRTIQMLAPILITRDQPKLELGYSTVSAK